FCWACTALASGGDAVKCAAWIAPPRAATLRLVCSRSLTTAATALSAPAVAPAESVTGTGLPTSPCIPCTLLYRMQRTTHPAGLSPAPWRHPPIGDQGMARRARRADTTSVPHAIAVTYVEVSSA